MLPTRLLPPHVLTVPLLVPLLVALVGLAGCAAPPATPTTTAPTSAAAPAGGHSGHGSGAAGLYAVQSGPLGVVVTDPDGRIVYRSDADSADPPTSVCTGACAQTWLPLVVTDGAEPELLGVDPSVVGRLDRADGTVQLTLAGWPLYHRADDAGGLETAGAHGTDGSWWAVTPTGERATTQQ